MAINLVEDSRDAEIKQLKQELEEIKSRSHAAGTPPQEFEETDNRDTIQKELDIAEEFVINTMFPDGVRVNSFIKTFLTMKGTDEVRFLNDAILKFESGIKPFMSPDGTMIITGKPSELIRLTAPLLEKLGKIIGG